MERNNLMCVLFHTTVLLAVRSESKECFGLNKTFTCPGPSDTEMYTECCWETSISIKCCPPKSVGPLYEIDEQQVMVAGVIVICSCLIITVVIVICCFWSKCLLYNACRVNYTQGNIVAYPKDDPLNSCMPEERGNQNNYSPNAIKVKPVEDV